MTFHTAPHTRRHHGLAIAGSVLLAGLLMWTCPQTARADAQEELQNIQQQIQEGNQAYDEATARVEELQSQMDENQARIDELEQKLPAQREQAADSIRLLYKMQQNSGSLIDLVLSSNDFFDLLSTLQYLNAVQSHNTDAVDQLANMVNELESTQADLDAKASEAKEEQQRASDALQQANDARSKLEDEIAAQAAAEEAERRAAIEAAQKEAAEAQAAAQAQAQSDAQSQQSNPTFTTESGSQATIQVPQNPDPDPGAVNWTDDKSSFVAEWSKRIDAYLAGSPLAGQGKTFAEAAWEYGVDPRLSPAISMVESSQGRQCFLPHNAWGWGNSSWDSWEEAIWDHVAGLASGYGGQLTYAAAKKYCPPNADHWYVTVLANMEQI